MLADDLLCELSLDSVDVYWLADFEYILGERSVYDVDLPSSRHKHTPKDRRYDKDHTDVEHDQICGVIREERWKHFLLEQEETEPLLSGKDTVLQGVNLLWYILVLVWRESLLQLPVIVGQVSIVFAEVG